MRTIKCSSISDAYKKGVEYILKNGVRKHIHGIDVFQANECVLEIRIDNDQDYCDLSPLGKQAALEYVTTFLDPDKKDQPYTYGERLTNYESFNQLFHAIYQLKRERNTRQAVCSIWNPLKDTSYDTPPCLQHVQFYMGDDNDFTTKVLFRSHDWYQALLYNMQGLKHMAYYVANAIDEEPKRLIIDSTCPHIYWYNYDMCREKWGLI